MRFREEREISQIATDADDMTNQLMTKEKVYICLCVGEITKARKRYEEANGMRKKER